MPLDVSWQVVERRLLELAQSAIPLASAPADRVLVRFGLVAGRELTPLAERYYVARFVREDPEETSLLLAEVLKQDPTVNAFCEAVWRFGQVPKTGAMNLLRRLERGVPDEQLTRLLEQMGRANLVAYNRRNPTIRGLYNPLELLPPDEARARERATGHVIAPETPYGNLLALREMIRSARGHVCWYEQHMPAKVLEVLYREIEPKRIERIRLLSGPENVDAALRSDLKRFRREFLSTRGVDVEWRVLSRREAANHHGRFFLTEGLVRNIPPINSIMKGSTDEILPSEIKLSDFDTWWQQGKDVFSSALSLDTG